MTSAEFAHVDREAAHLRRRHEAGTSYLFKLLERHPGIEMTPVKEIHYFAHVHTPISFLDDSARVHALKTYVNYVEPGDGITDTRRKLQFFSRYLRTPIDDAWYESLFQSGEETYKADFSNMASVLPEDGLRHMRRIADDLRVIYIIRDPLARLWSHVKFHAAVNDELFRLSSFGRGEFASYIEASGAAAQGRYANNVERMRRHIPADRLKIIYFEDLVGSPRETLGAIFDFLELAPIVFDDRELEIVHNPGPEADMPVDFAEAAACVVAPLLGQLARVGIARHPQWRTPSAAPGPYSTSAAWQTPDAVGW